MVGRRICDVYKEACFGQKYFYKWVFLYKAEMERHFREWKHSDSPVKKKVPVTAVNKKRTC